VAACDLSDPGYSATYDLGDPLLVPACGLSSELGSIFHRPDLSSACVDSGSNTGLPADVADLDADANTTEPLARDACDHARVTNGTVDIGSNEAPNCYADCDHDYTITVLDYNCFLNAYSAGDSYANCDGSTSPPVLNVLDFNCFLSAFNAGCY
jgi:hypothetical protein